MIDPYFIPVILSAGVGGAGTGLLGVQIVGMRMPLLAVVMAHAAMVGAVFVRLAGLGDAWIVPCSAAAAMVTAIPLGALRPSRLRIDPNVLLGVLFSVTMGLAFLGIGLCRGDQTTMLSLLWGNLLSVGWGEFAVVASTAAALVIFVTLFGKELRAILFSRELAAAGGVHEGPVWMGYLALSGVTLAVNLSTVGGLMIFSLLANPTVAAGQLVRGYRALLWCSALLGALSALGGFAAAYLFDFPAGASIVLTSSVLLGVAVAWRRLRGRHD